ncbi:uncharacterized protein [Primulina huaijiensis]|uniref:uncharacterized protein n=1 Tax=Primulina huaijiensis TaxID=1492673 RepID=UPI003CC70E83
MARKLRPYFLSHPITVLTNNVLGKIFSHPDTSGRLIKWVTELSEYVLAETVQVSEEEQWKVFVDGSSCRTGSEVRIVIISPWGEETKVAVRLNFRASNNEAEYEALLVGLRAARSMGVTRAVLYSDSQLVIQQSKGKFEVKNEKMVRYAKAFEKTKEDFSDLIKKKISRAKNETADRMAKMASSLDQPTEPELIGQELVSQIDHLQAGKVNMLEEDWRYEVQQYLCHGKVPAEPKRAREFKRRALRFLLLDGILYKRSFSRPLLKCLGPEEADYVLQEIHEGCCGNHLGEYSSGSESFNGRLLLANHEKRCAHEEWCKEMKIEQIFTSVAYPQRNGQVEVTNRSIVHTLKTRLDSAKRKWVEELPSVLWAYRTTARIGNGETPYNLV